ncbi:MAG TPA: hypothetical protein VNV43_03080 [Candidatus Acidoferrales bacterium]|jgi:hypothetical protein|nr:hypothetical protein [Candidatus Acidoferrales bacterium]
MRFLSVIEKRPSNRAISPTLTPVLLGIAVIVAHLLLAKLLWGFPWAGFVVGLSLVAFLTLGIGYFYVWFRRPGRATQESEIVEILDKALLGRTHANQSAGPAFEGGGDGGNAVCKMCRLIRGPQPPIRVLSPMAQKRCNKTQKNSRAQLPNLRF